MGQHTLSQRSVWKRVGSDKPNRKILTISGRLLQTAYQNIAGLGKKSLIIKADRKDVQLKPIQQ